MSVAGVESPARQAVLDRAAKRDRVLEILARAGRDSVLLTSHTAVSWYLDGSRVGISLAGDPVAAVLVTGDGDHLVTFNNEAARLAAEEVPVGVEIHQVPWYGSLTDVACWYGPGVSPAAEAELAEPLRLARRALLPGELARYGTLCRDTSAVLTDVLTGVTPQTTERRLVAELGGRIVAAGADPLVLLANGASRSGFRHPLPTDTVLGRRAMAVVCARRDGMIANVTRWVRFDASTPDELDAEARIAAVEADIFAATVPGAAVRDILAAIRRSYERHGFGPDQWRLHHQGGPAGYAGRDPRATDAVADAVVANQPFTWNPSGPGVKIEDTVLLEAAGIRPLSMDPRWPVTDVNGLPRPVTLQL
ncbi:M24 family metallopeptidase [Specibacter cremeus]|uniref:M24 family metallopeptidase n=1 Tax=Specibacter cremeus TaxID=1629051 RepID=UPI000F781BE7|nr:aminopeptidase P family protein [Specibacter cremeus]